nr:V-type ATPase subunit [Deinobacterium chartae]
MRTQLMTERRLEEALAAPSYPEFLRILSEGEFGEDLGEATGAGAGLSELDKALSRNFYRTAQRLLGFADGTARKEISALLMRWDLLNLKTVARGLVTGRSAQAILEGLVPGGLLKRPLLEAAVAAGDLSGAAQAISVSGHPLAKVFRQAVATYVNTGDLLDLEIQLDQGYYAQARKASQSEVLRRYFAQEIDLRNALTAVQLRGSGQGNVRYFVPGGRKLNETDFMRIVGGDTSSPSPELAPIIEAETIQAAEAAARAQQLEKTRGLAMGDPLGMGVPADFLRRKEIEIAQLRLIGRGKYYRVPNEQIRQELSHA